MKLAFKFSDDVPEEARKTLIWSTTRFIEVGLGAMKSIRTCVPGFDRKKSHLDPEDRIHYLIGYEDREDDTLVTITVEKPDA